MKQKEDQEVMVIRGNTKSELMRTGSGVLLSLFLTLSASAVFAQRGREARGEGRTVPSRALNYKDSLQVRGLFFEGLHEKIVQNYPQAIASFTRILEIDPANDAAQYELANLHFAGNKMMEAEQLIRGALKVNPGNEWYWTVLADIHKKNNNLSGLVEVLKELNKLRPDKADYYYDHANALMMLQKNKEANQLYTEIEKKFGSSPELQTARQRILLQQSKPEDVEKQLERLIAASPSDIRNYLLLSEMLAKANEREKAIKVLNRAKAVEPANALIRLSLADLYKALNQFDNTFIELKVAFADPQLSIDEKVRIVLSFFPMFKDMKARAFAEELASIMIRVHPDEAKAFAMYGDVLFQERKLAEAQESYRKALQLNDQIFQIWEQLLRIGLNRGDFKSLLEDGEQALAIFPNQASLYLYTGIALTQTGNHEKAVSYLTTAAELGTENRELLAQVYATLGDSYNALKRFKESNKAYEQALEINPKNAYVLNNYAYYLSLRGEDLIKAEKMSRLSVELDPNNPSFEDTYAWVLFRLKRFTEARDWIERALKNSSKQNATQVEHYGDILYFLGEKEPAAVQWRKARTLGSKSETLERKINENRYIE